MKATDLRSKSVDELNAELLKLREEQFKNNMKKATGQLDHTHLVKLARRDVARIKTVLNEKSKAN